MPQSAVRLDKLPEPVVVTGAGGFIGRRLVERLLNEGKLVRALDLLECPPALRSRRGLEWYRSDITDSAALARGIASAGCVFHLAAIVGDWGSPQLHQEVNVEATRQLLNRIRDQEPRCRVVLASSIVVYGDRLNKGVCHEGLPHGTPQGPYSESKQAQERLMQQYLQQGLDIRIVRPANVYGAGSKPWVEDLCTELKRKTPALIGGGDFNAGLVHVDNVVEMLIRSARSRISRGQIYNVADEEGVTWKQYLNDLAEACGAPEPRVMPRTLARVVAIAGENLFRALNRPKRPPLTREALNLVGSNVRIDIRKAKQELGYQPRKTYLEGLAEIRNSLKAAANP